MAEMAADVVLLGPTSGPAELCSCICKIGSRLEPCVAKTNNRALKRALSFLSV